MIFSGILIDVPPDSFIIDSADMVTRAAGVAEGARVAVVAGASKLGGAVTVEDAIAVSVKAMDTRCDVVSSMEIKGGPDSPSQDCKIGNRKIIKTIYLMILIFLE